MKIGDLVRMKPKNYSSPGCSVPDQWRGLVGVITEDLCNESLHDAFSVFIKHPDEPTSIEIFVYARDVEVISEGR